MKVDSDMEPELAAELDQERLGDAEVTGGESDSLEAVEGPEVTGEGGEVLGEDMARRDPEMTSTGRARRSNTTAGQKE
jgi:hypothetical protein